MKTALITGAAGGIGFECVKELCSKGYYTIGIDIQQNESIFESYKSVADSEYFCGDITQKESRAKLFELLIKRGCGLDVLINAAGVAPKQRADILDVGEESYDRVMGINTKALFFLTQEAANFMLKHNQNSGGVKGYIINISSMSAYTSSVSRPEYCISKAGVSMITTLFADRLAAEGILVNEIRPGIIETPMTSAVKDKYDALIAGGLLPVKRWGTPPDVAKAASALISGSFDYTTGQSVDVDGGFHMRRL